MDMDMVMDTINFQSGPMVIGGKISGVMKAEDGEGRS
jgi:hypothetical protein